MTSPETPTSARYPGRPVPSTTVPPPITRSNMSPPPSSALDRVRGSSGGRPARRDDRATSRAGLEDPLPHHSSVAVEAQDPGAALARPFGHGRADQHETAVARAGQSARLVVLGTAVGALPDERAVLVQPQGPQAAPSPPGGVAGHGDA